MLIVRYLAAGERAARIGVAIGDEVRPVAVARMADLLRHPLAEIRRHVERASAASPIVEPVRLLPPLDGRMEVWGAGVTYERSRSARMAESSQADVYDRVYDAERPELFFKCAAWRVVTTGEPIAIRRDSTIDVPEPELAVVANSAGALVGYLVCDDVSSRSIEGANPLYLPQAKVYAGACALSGGVRPAWEVPAPDALDVKLTIARDGGVVWRGAVSTAELRRPPADLLAHLFAEEQFPDGVVLSTGTGIVPELGFTLREDDVVAIRIEQIGALTNPVVRGKQSFAWLAGEPGDRPGLTQPAPDRGGAGSHRLATQGAPEHE